MPALAYRTDHARTPSPLVYRSSSKIFIGGLSFETTDEALKRYFEQFGQVSDAIVMKDAVSRRSRGFGFITYMSSASVDEALSVKQHIVDNRRVEAKRAVPRSEVPTKVRGGTHVFEMKPYQSRREGYILRTLSTEIARTSMYEYCCIVAPPSPCAPLMRLERETPLLYLFQFYSLLPLKMVYTNLYRVYYNNHR